MLLKKSGKAKTMLEDKQNELNRNKAHPFGKKSQAHMIEVKKSKKKSLEAFKDEKSLCEKKSSL